MIAAGRGPLKGIRIVEIAGLGPTPFASMVLADLGADVIRIDRPGGSTLKVGAERFDVLNRSRPSVVLNLKQPEAIHAALTLIDRADVLIEGMRPGVMERMGLGPDVCHARNEKLIYARMTGWGQTGPLARKAGHDINYIALSGALYLMGPANAPPPPPINLVGDFGGGGMFVVTGILAALVSRASTGKGQVIDAAMVDGAAVLLSQIFAWRAMGFWTDVRENNLLDGGCYFYRCYETADGKYLAVGAIEAQFHDAFLTGLGLDPTHYPTHFDRAHWPERTKTVADLIRSRTRDEWVARFEKLDACVSPVLTPQEATTHPANSERKVFVDIDGLTQPAPAPRFSHTPAAACSGPSESGQGGADALAAWGLSSTDIAVLLTDN